MNAFLFAPSARQLKLPAPAKINRFLHVVGRRDDGYHLLQSAFQLIDLADTITLTLRNDAEIVRTHGMADVAPEQDLAVRAARLLQQHTGCSRGVDIAVEKRIPAGGGLGGGSSDAATVLIGLNHLWQLGLGRDALQKLALPLGADVPFFVFGRNAFVQGVGEHLQTLDLPQQTLLLINPGIAVPTGAIFSAPELTRNSTPITMRGFLAASQTWTGLHNDLQAVAAQRYEKIRAALDWLNHQPNSSQARMSGSGGCCFAVWQGADEGPAAPVPQAPPGMQCWWVKTLTQHPLYEAVN